MDCHQFDFNMSSDAHIRMEGVGGLLMPRSGCRCAVSADLGVFSLSKK